MCVEKKVIPSSLGLQKYGGSAQLCQNGITYSSETSSGHFRKASHYIFSHFRYLINSFFSFIFLNCNHADANKCNVCLCIDYLDA